MEKSAIYFDQAATSFPKPPILIEQMSHFLANEIGTTRRRGYATKQYTDDLIEQTRANILHFIGAPNHDQIIYTANATEAINMVLQGYLEEGDHVLTSPFEHSAVSRTLVALSKQKNIQYSIVKPNPSGIITVKEVERFIQPNTKLLAFCHGSNVTGNIIVGDDIGQWANQKKIAFFLDVSQSIGSYPIDVSKLQPTFMAFSGHKSLLGPTGVGCLYLKQGTPLRLFRYGGTGYQSEYDWIEPKTASDYETGTQNVLSIAGLQASLKYIQERRLTSLIQHKQKLTSYFISQLKTLSNVQIYGNTEVERLPIVSFNIDQFDPVTEIAPLLDHSFNIVTRAGLHCSPWAHKYIGTFPIGTIRVSFGAFHTKSDVDQLLNALDTIQKLKVG